MAWNLSSDRPIYIQLLEGLKRRIVTGEYKAGSQIPPVRELAVEAGVNPNTMQKALLQLEGEGLVYSVRTSGRFVTDNTAHIENAKKEMAKANVNAFLNSMAELAITKDEIMKLIEESEIK